MVKHQTETSIKGRAPESSRFPVSDKSFSASVLQFPNVGRGWFHNDWSHTQCHGIMPRVYFGAWVWDFNSAWSLFFVSTHLPHSAPREGSGGHTKPLPCDCLSYIVHLFLSCTSLEHQIHHSWAEQIHGKSTVALPAGTEPHIPKEIPNSGTRAHGGGGEFKNLGTQQGKGCVFSLAYFYIKASQ